MTRRKPGSLRWRIVAIVAILLTVTNVVVGAVTVLAFQGYLYGRVDSDLATAAQRALDAQGELPSPPPDGTNPPPSGSASGTTGSGSGTTGSDPDHDFIGAPGQSPDTIVAVYRTGSFVLAGYTDAKGVQHRLDAAAKATLRAVPRTGRAVTVDVGSRGEYRVVAKVSKGAVFITGLPLAGIQSSIARLAVVIGIVALLGVVAAAWAGAVLVRRSMRSLSSVAATASAVTVLDLDRGAGEIPIRVAPRDLAANREVGQVGAALNRLLGHVSRALTVRDRAERSVREFVADASHELRTPIATIRAYAELTRRQRLDDGSRANVERIESEAVRMGELVEELLLLARLDAADWASAAQAPFSVAEVDLSSLVVEALMDARAAAPGHRWSIDVDDEPVRVIGDAGQLRRVVVNLLANARTHTPAGTTVEVTVHRIGARAVVAVANDGPRIEERAIPTLFDRFTRGDASRSRERGTTGLGLAIVRAVAEAHHGTVAVTSDDARTVFRIELPAG